MFFALNFRVIGTDSDLTYQIKLKFTSTIYKYWHLDFKY